MLGARFDLAFEQLRSGNLRPPENAANIAKAAGASVRAAREAVHNEL